MPKITKFTRLCFGLLFILAIIYLGSLVDFIFKPVLSLITIITIPLMLSVFFYYLLRPLVDFMERKKINRTLSILLIYVAAAVIMTGFVLIVWPPMRTQLMNLVENAPSLIEALSDQLQKLEQEGVLAEYFQGDNNPVSLLTEYVNKGFTFLTEYITGLFSVISNIAVVLVISPVFLFYQLKQSGRFGSLLVRMVPIRFRGEMEEAVKEMDKALSGFIVGRVIVNLALGLLMYIGFALIGLPYALLLSAVAVILNFIPFVGAFLSAIPVVIIGFIESPTTAVWSLVIILAAQQIQDNVIAPYVFGKQLDIHPITTIVLVMVGSDLAGILGMLLVIPVYMIVKIMVVKVYNLFFKEKWENA